jgi:hypothetical protein
MMKCRIEEVIRKNLDIGILNDWEMSFLNSLLRQVEKRALSTKQNNWLQKIEAKVAEAIDPSWEAAWDAEKARELRIAIDYYSYVGTYFRDIVQWVKDNPNKIINKVNYQKITQNKFAQKAINALNTKTKFDNGAQVCLRKNAPTPRGMALNSRSGMLFIVQALDKAVSAVQGARLYTVLPCDSAQIYEIEERHIKKYPKKA